MFIIKFDLVLFLTICHVTHGERRIVDGSEVTSDKSYVVYLVKAKESDKTYDSWLCGGALVTKQFIITSAACVEDVRFMYAVAGYRKYVNDKDLNKDECTKHMRKKIVYTCVPVSYEFDFDQIEKWAHIDLALVKVESPYDFNDARYQMMCSYVPKTIPINYDMKRQANNVDAIVLGWGHTERWRQHGDTNNYNQEYLRFGATTLYDKKKCVQEYKYYPDLTKVIEKYMICSLEPGHLNDHGVPYSVNQGESNKKMSGCITVKQKLKGTQGRLCEGEVEHPEEELMGQLIHAGDTRKHMSLKESNNNDTQYEVNGTDFRNGTDVANRTDIANGTNIANETNIVNGADIVNGTDIANFNNTIHKSGFGIVSGYFNRTFTRRNGICQNDHGGPLVTWVGKREVLIGIASVFKITADNKCRGPYLYTSTVCNGAFIGCVLDDKRANGLRGHNESVSTRKALLCDRAPSVRGFDTMESYVSWKDHPDGPADNEKDMLRDKPEPNQNKDRFATNVEEVSDEDFANLLNVRQPQQDKFPQSSPKEEEQKPFDRFSLNIGLPPEIKPPPRKRPRLRKRRPPIFGSPPETALSRIIRSKPEIKPQPLKRPSPELEFRPKITLPTQMELSTTIGPPETKPVPTIMEPRPMMKLPQEMKPSPIQRPLLIQRPSPVQRPSSIPRLPLTMRPRPIIKPRPILRPPPKLEPPPTAKPPMEPAPTEFDEMQDLESEEVNL